MAKNKMDFRIDTILHTFCFMRNIFIEKKITAEDRLETFLLKKVTKHVVFESGGSVGRRLVGRGTGGARS